MPVRVQWRVRFARRAGVLVAASATVLALLSGGAVPDADAASCIVYSPDLAAASADLAFDGTVVAIGTTRPRIPGSVGDLMPVTFIVTEWYRGGPGWTITADLPVTTGTSMLELPPPVEIGTRLLVSGDVRQDVPRYVSMRAGICGYTRYHDVGTADEWRAAVG